MTGSLDEGVLVSEDGKKVCTPTGGRYWCMNSVPGYSTPEGGFGGAVGNERFGKRWYDAAHSEAGNAMDNE